MPQAVDFIHRYVRWRCRLRTGLFLAALFCVVVSPAAGSQTLEDLGLPSLVTYEAVFPNVSFGNHGVDIRSEILVINPTSRDAFVELLLFNSVGGEITTAQLWIEVTSDTDQPRRRRLGSLRRVIRADSSETFSFPLENYELEHGLFSGWVRVRSNQPVAASLKIRAKNVAGTGFATHVDSPGDREGNLEATVPVGQAVTKREGTGIAIVNPGPEPLQLTLRRIAPSETVQTEPLRIEPGTQHIFFQHEFFGLKHPPSSSDRTRTIEILSENGALFALSAIGVLDFNGGRYPIFQNRPGPEKVESEAWNFPVQVVDLKSTAALNIVLTEFGFYLTTPQFTNVRPFHLNAGSKISLSEVGGIAVVDGFEAAVIFLSSENVLYLEDVPGDFYAINPTSENLVEIVMLELFVTHFATATDLWTFVLIDKEQEKVIDRFQKLGVRTIPPVPPWRQE